MPALAYSRLDDIVGSAIGQSISSVSDFIANKMGFMLRKISNNVKMGLKMFNKDLSKLNGSVRI